MILGLAGIFLASLPLNGWAQSGDVTRSRIGGADVVSQAPKEDKSNHQSKTIVGGFKSLSGMDSETEVIEYKESPDDVLVKGKDAAPSGDARRPYIVGPLWNQKK
jgi:hypothetical protein